MVHIPITLALREFEIEDRLLQMTRPAEDYCHVVHAVVARNRFLEVPNEKHQCPKLVQP